MSKRLALILFAIMVLGVSTAYASTPPPTVHHTYLLSKGIDNGTEPTANKWFVNPYKLTLFMKVKSYFGYKCEISITGWNGSFTHARFYSDRAITTDYYRDWITVKLPRAEWAWSTHVKETNAWGDTLTGGCKYYFRLYR